MDFMEKLRREFAYALNGDQVLNIENKIKLFAKMAYEQYTRVAKGQFDHANVRMHIVKDNPPFHPKVEVAVKENK